MRTFILSLLLLLNVSCFALEFTSEEKQWIEEHPHITYVGDPAWLPYEGYDKQGKYTGIVPDVLALLSQRLPFDFKHIQTATWQESLDKVSSGKVMMISQSQYSNAQTDLEFVQTSKNPVVIVMQEGEDYVSSLYQISHKRIGLIDNTTTTPVLQSKYPHMQFITYKSAHKGLEAVSVGKIDAFLCSLPRASYIIAQNRLLNLRIVGKSDVDTSLGFGIHADYPLLVSIMGKLVANTSEEDVHVVLAKWSRQEYVEKVDYTLLYISLGVFTTIMLMGLGFYLRLKYESQKRLRLQAQMLEQQAKMAAMGEMLDAVAHQWKQPLNALSMYADLLKSDFDEGRVDRSYIDEMLEGVNTQIEHMLVTLREFRDFFRPNQEVSSFLLSEVIDSACLLVKDEFLKHTIEIEIDVDEDLKLHGNANEFKHLILNIINNAKDAFNEKQIKERLIRIHATIKGKVAFLSIEDSAGGIDPEVIEKVFEANVTTKEKGKGTGIGLYMSAQIVEKLKGSISVHNTDTGACFEVVIPLD